MLDLCCRFAAKPCGDQVCLICIRADVLWKLSCITVIRVQCLDGCAPCPTTKAIFPAVCPGAKAPGIRSCTRKAQHTRCNKPEFCRFACAWTCMQALEAVQRCQISRLLMNRADVLQLSSASKPRCLRWRSSSCKRYVLHPFPARVAVLDRDLAIFYHLPTG